MKFNIYVPSYHRSNAILTDKLLDYCTYVVRKSEEQAYKDAGVRSIWAVEDELIDSAEKVFLYIREHSPEEVVCILDDDIKSFSYRLDKMEQITDPVVITEEIERLAQLMYDLNVGYLASPIDSNVMYYDRPFKFTGVTGALKIYNKEVFKYKAHDDFPLLYLSDMETELQELLFNRIIIIPVYFCVESYVDTNEGGNSGTKCLSQIDAENEMMKNKWGKYYEKADGGKAGRIKVDR